MSAVVRVRKLFLKVHTVISMCERREKYKIKNRRKDH
jgi:hypothetical protein